MTPHTVIFGTITTRCILLTGKRTWSYLNILHNDQNFSFIKIFILSRIQLICTFTCWSSRDTLANGTHIIFARSVWKGEDAVDQWQPGVKEHVKHVCWLKQLTCSSAIHCWYGSLKKTHKCNTYEGRFLDNNTKNESTNNKWIYRLKRVKQHTE